VVVLEVIKIAAMHLVVEEVAEINNQMDLMLVALAAVFV
jgi:hypothetical protein